MEDDKKTSQVVGATSEEENLRLYRRFEVINPQTLAGTEESKTINQLRIENGLKSIPNGDISLKKMD